MPVDTSLAADSRVIMSPEKQGAVSWPLPIEAKLEVLLRRAVDAGERTSRKEIVAALIAAADFDDDSMSTLLRGYRKITVRELLDIPQSENVIPISQGRKPGPRPRDPQQSRS